MARKHHRAYQTQAATGSPPAPQQFSWTDWQPQRAVPPRTPSPSGTRRSRSCSPRPAMERELSWENVADLPTSNRNSTQSWVATVAPDSPSVPRGRSPTRSDLSHSRMSRDPSVPARHPLSISPDRYPQSSVRSRPPSWAPSPRPHSAAPSVFSCRGAGSPDLRSASPTRSVCLPPVEDYAYPPSVAPSMGRPVSRPPSACYAYPSVAPSARPPPSTAPSVGYVYPSGYSCRGAGSPELRSASPARSVCLPPVEDYAYPPSVAASMGRPVSGPPSACYAYPSARPATIAPAASYPPSAAPSARPPPSAAPSARPPLSVAPSLEDLPYSRPGSSHAPSLPGQSPLPAEITAAEVLFPSDTAFLRRYRNVRETLEMLRAPELAELGSIRPEIMVLGTNEPLRAQIVASLTGVLVRRENFVPCYPAVTWFASDHAAGEIDGLDAMRRAVTVCLEHPQKINVASREIELTVYEYRGTSLTQHQMKEHMANPLGFVIVADGEEHTELPPAWLHNGAWHRKTLYVGSSASETSSETVKRTATTLTGMLDNLLYDFVDSASGCMRRRLAQLQQDLLALPAPVADPTPVLSRILLDFSDDVQNALGSLDARPATTFDFGDPADAKLRRAVLHSAPQYDVRPSHPSPPVLPGLFGPRPVAQRPPPPAVGTIAYSMHAGPGMTVAPMSPGGPCRSLASSPKSMSPSMMFARSSVRGPMVAAPIPRSPPLKPFPELASPRLGEPAIGAPPPMAELVFEPLPPSMSLADVMGALARTAAGDLPGHFQTGDLCKDYTAQITKSWAEPANAYLDAMVKRVVWTAQQVIDASFKSYKTAGLPDKVAEVVRAKVLAGLKNTREEVSKLLQAEANLAIEDEEAFLASSDVYLTRFSTEAGVLHTSTRAEKLRRNAALSVMATVSAYFDLSHKRFLESVKRAVHAHLLGTVSRDLASELMAKIDIGDAAKWLQVSQDTTSKRAELEDRVACLRRAKDELSVSLLS